MILRSITKHVRDQNWFAVGLDFLIVVLGILLAFQKRRTDAPSLLLRVEIPTGGAR